MIWEGEAFQYYFEMTSILFVSSESKLIGRGLNEDQGIFVEGKALLELLSLLSLMETFWDSGSRDTASHNLDTNASSINKICPSRAWRTGEELTARALIRRQTRKNNNQFQFI
jgi:hypothetical protein